MNGKKSKLEEKVTHVQGILRERIPNAQHSSQEYGMIYGFRVDTEKRSSWLYLDRKFLANNSFETTTNLFNVYNVVDALQDEKKPQKLFFDGMRLGKHQQ